MYPTPDPPDVGLFSEWVMAAAPTGENRVSSWSKWTPTLKGVAKLQVVEWAVAEAVAVQKLPQTLDTPEIVDEEAGAVCSAAISR